MISDSQKSHFCQEMRRQRLVQLLQNDTYLPIRENPHDKVRRRTGRRRGGEGAADGYRCERVIDYCTCRSGRERERAENEGANETSVGEGKKENGAGNNKLLFFRRDEMEMSPPHK